MARWSARLRRSSRVMAGGNTTTASRPTARAMRDNVRRLGLFRPDSYAAIVGCDVPAARASSACVRSAVRRSSRTAFIGISISKQI